MLKKLLIVSLAVFTLASCKKDKNEEPATYHLTAKIDGAKVDFSVALAAEVYHDPTNGYTLSVLGMGGQGNAILPAFDFIIQDDATITTKTYTSAQHIMTTSYTDVSSESYDADDDFSITVTSITSTEVRGTFKGKLVHSGTLDIVNVTEGTFYAKIY
jgi:hypothetical protein